MPAGRRRTKSPGTSGLKRSLSTACQAVARVDISPSPPLDFPRSAVIVSPKSCNSLITHDNTFEQNVPWRCRDV